MNCPHCNSDLRGKEIPLEYLDKGYYGDWTEEDGYLGEVPRYYGREIVVEVRGVYDGGLYYLCPDCGKAWHRWENDYMRAKAQPYIDRVNGVA